MYAKNAIKTVSSWSLLPARDLIITSFQPPLVQSLEHDVSAIKDVLQSRISSAEEGLESLQATQEKLLTSELHAAKTAIVHDLIGQLEEWFVTKTELKTEM